MPSGRTEVAAVAAVIAAAFMIRSLRRTCGEDKESSSRKQSLETDALKIHLRRRLSSSVYNNKLAEEMLRACERAGEDWQPPSPREEESKRTVLDEQSLEEMGEEEAYKVTSCLLTLTSALPQLEPLNKFKNMRHLIVESSLPLSLDALGVLRGLSHLSVLDLRRCRVCVDDNNISDQYCSAASIFAFARSSRHLRELLLPDWFTFRIGSITRCFARAGVAVVSLTQSLCVGDTVQLRRVAQDVKDDLPHEWRSEPCEVSSIRDEHSHSLHEASPTARECEFSVGLRHVGKKNDMVYWMGVSVQHSSF